MEEEDKALRAIGSSVVKAIVAICLAVWMCFWINSCGVDKETIQECRSACNGAESQMRSVSSRSCECEKKSSNEWVIPRTRSSSSGTTTPLTVP